VRRRHGGLQDVSVQGNARTGDSSLGNECSESCALHVHRHDAGLADIRPGRGRRLNAQNTVDRAIQVLTAMKVQEHISRWKQVLPLSVALAMIASSSSWGQQASPPQAQAGQAAQPPATQSQPAKDKQGLYKFRVESQLVLVNATVRDKQGQPVTGLKK